MKVAAYAILASALFHVLALIGAGFHEDALYMLPHLVIYPLLAFGLWRGKFWTAWIALIFLIIGIGVATSDLVGGSIVPGWALMGILVTDAVAAIALIGAIWKGRPSTNLA